MYLERVGVRFVAAMAVLLAVAGNVAFAQEHKTYRCKVVDVVEELGEDGHLHSQSKGYLRYLYDGALIDTLTGAVTRSDGARSVMSVVQAGNDKFDYVLIHNPFGLSPNQMAISAACVQRTTSQTPELIAIRVIAANRPLVTRI